MKVKVEDSDSKATEITNSITSKCQNEVKKQIKAHNMSPNDAIDMHLQLVPIHSLHVNSRHRIKRLKNRPAFVITWQDNGKIIHVLIMIYLRPN